MRRLLMSVVTVAGMILLGAIPAGAWAQSTASWAAGLTNGFGSIDCADSVLNGPLSASCAGLSQSTSVGLTADPGGILHGQLSGVSAAGEVYHVNSSASLSFADIATIACTSGPCKGTTVEARFHYSTELTAAIGGSFPACANECGWGSSAFARFDASINNGSEWSGDFFETSAGVHTDGGTTLFFERHTGTLATFLFIEGGGSFDVGIDFGFSLEGGLGGLGSDHFGSAFAADASHTMFLDTFRILDGDGLDVTHTYAIAWQHGTIVGGVAAIPEPETYAMMLAGLALVGAVARRRVKKSA